MTLVTPASPHVHATHGPTSPPLLADQQQLLRFAVGPEGYAIPIDAVRELVEVPTLTTLPLMPAFMRGVMNLRGAVVPIIDLGARLGQPAAPLTRRSCVVIVDAADATGQTQLVGMLVDAVHEVLDASEIDMESAPQLGTKAPPDFLIGVARLRNTLIEVLSLPRVLDLDQLADLIGAQVAH